MNRRKRRRVAQRMGFNFLRTASTCVCFPLTPTLSLGEREERVPQQAEVGRVHSSMGDCKNSLSSGERAGVRGKETPLLLQRSKKCGFTLIWSNRQLMDWLCLVLSRD